MDGMLISIIVFLVVYAAITFELVNKAVAAFSGVSVLVLLNIISPHVPGIHSVSEEHHVPSADQNIRKNNFQDEYNGVEYSFSIHSNDIIKLELINHIITEKREVSKDKIAELREQVITEY